MGAAKKCGIRAAEIRLLRFGKDVVCVERFDRNVTVVGDGLQVERLHQEDMAQAFSLSSQSKYLELVNGTYFSIAQLLRQRSENPLIDIESYV